MSGWSLPVKVDKGEGPPVVLLHGLGNNYTSWTYVLDKLDYATHRVIALDLLGFGDAPKPTDIDYTSDDHAQAVIATLDELGVSGAIVVGHSMGCLVAARLALTRPDLAGRLVLLGSPVFQTVSPQPKSLRFWQRESAYLALFALISRERDMTIAAAEGVDTFAPLVKGMEITQETWLAFRRSLEHTITRTDGFTDLEKTTVPTHLVYGLLDVFVISRNLKILAKRNRWLTYQTLLGPHEISPFQGRRIVALIQGD